MLLLCLPLIPPELAACSGTAVEFFMPLLLVLGLGTRVAALGLFVMTSTIQLLVFPDAWPTHIQWFAILLVLLRQGGGKLALDNWLVPRMANFTLAPTNPAVQSP